MAKKMIEIDGIEYVYSITQKIIKLISCSLKEDVEILKLPESIEGLPVENIDKRFMIKNPYKIEKLIIPNSVKVIGDFAFKENEKLLSVVLSNNIKELSNGCFEMCYELKKVEVDYNDSLLESIGGRCFFRCSKLEEFKCPKNLKVLENGCFDECYNRKSSLSLYLNENLINVDKNFINYSFSLRTKGNQRINIFSPFSLIMKEIIDLNHSTAKVEISDIKAEVTVDGIEYWITTNGAVAVRTDFLGPNLIFPNTVFYNEKEYFIIAIMDDFSIRSANKTIIEKVVLPNKIIYIGDKAFNNLTFNCPIIYPSTLKTEKNTDLLACHYKYYERDNTLCLGNGYRETSYSDISKDKIIYEDEMYYLETDDGLKCLKYIGDSEIMPDLTKPLKNGKIVNGILPLCFYDSNIKEYYISKNIETIGRFAFGLEQTKVTFAPDSNLKALGESAIVLRKNEIYEIPSSIEYICISTFSDENDNLLFAYHPSKVKTKNIFYINNYEETLFIPKNVEYIEFFSLSRYVNEIVFEDDSNIIYGEFPYFGDECYGIYENVKYNEINGSLYLGSKNNKNIVFCGTKHISTPYLNIEEGTRIITKHSLYKYDNLMMISLPDSVVGIYSELSEYAIVRIEKWPKSLRYVAKQFLENVDFDNSMPLPKEVIIIDNEYTDEKRNVERSWWI